jgi:N-methylhydantoinase B
MATQSVRREEQIEPTQCDPITLEIIQSSLQSLSDEMFATMRKTAMSSAIYEVLDFGVAVTDAKGELAASGAGIPGFIGMIDSGVKAIIAKFGPRGAIHPGDIFIANRPNFGGVSHINDVTLMLPIFAEGEIIAWVANKGHWIDMGGAAPGSISPQATEIFQEGLQLPELKLFDAGELVEPIIEIMKANVRLPELLIGDCWAGVASMRSGERRILELVKKYGKTTVLFAINNYMSYLETITRNALGKLPVGTYGAEDYLDDGRKLIVQVQISKDEFLVDLRGNPVQDKYSFNSTYEATVIVAQLVFKAITSPHSPANAGSFRPLKVLCDPGTICNAQFPAAMSIYFEVSIRLLDLIWKALAAVCPDRLSVGHYACICGTFMGGPSPETGRPHSFVEPEIGGWGASFDDDGENAQYTAYHGDTYNCPAELNEARNGIMVEQYALNPESGGAGRFRGGKGIYLDYRILADDWWLTFMYSRSKHGPWGLEGGHEGTGNYIRIIRKEGSEEVYSTATNLNLKKGDIVRVATANGGGVGDPKQRDRGRLLEDIRNGYVTLDEAISIYGLDPKAHPRKTDTAWSTKSM